MEAGLRRSEGVSIMSYCLHCGRNPDEPHMRICPESDERSEYKLADEVTPARAEPRHLSPIADGTQSTLEYIRAIRDQLSLDPPALRPSDSPVEAAEGDRSLVAAVILTAPASAAGDVQGLPHAI